MSKTPLPRPPWPWADPLWWARQQIRATTFAAHMTEAVVRSSLAAYGDAARASVHALAHGSAPWGAWGIATATPAAPVRETPVITEPLVKAAEPLVNGAGPAARELNGQLTAPAPRPELTSVPPAAELTAVTPELTAVTPELTAVTPEPQPAAAPQGPAEAPVPGWDELTLGSIRARLRRLSEDDLVALHDWEEAHAARPDVLSMLVNRLAKIRSAEEGA